jgi:CBS domain-containing protein
MSRDLVFVPPETRISEAAAIMGTHRIGSVLVGDSGSLAGIFTERDIVRAISQSGDAPNHAVTDWMTREPVTVQAESGIEDARQLMLEGGFRHLPVLEAGSIIGMLSMRDLVASTA